jgi:hypothetical protein
VDGTDSTRTPKQAGRRSQENYPAIRLRNGAKSLWSADRNRRDSCAAPDFRRFTASAASEVLSALRDGLNSENGSQL